MSSSMSTPFSKINNMVPVQKLENEWISEKMSECDRMLQKRASPKVDVGSIRHSDKRDLRLVPSENFPRKIFRARSQSLRPLAMQNWKATQGR